MKAPSRSVERRQRLRERLGAGLYRLGLHRHLYPVGAPPRGRIRQRLIDYLEHYLRTVTSAETELWLAPLGGRFCCDLNDHMLAPYLREQKPIYEQAEIEFFRRQVRQADWIVDIGANHGFWGVGLARAAAGTRARLFEANPGIASRLRRTLALAPSLDVRLFECAVTDGSQAQVSFFRPQGNLSGLGSTVLHAFANDHGYLREDDRILVPARSLDQIVDSGDLGGMDLVKIDVEQAEDGVIRGGARAIARFRPRLLMVETSADSAATRCLRELGYRVSVLGTDGQETELVEGYWGNLLFRDGAGGG